MKLLPRFERARLRSLIRINREQRAAFKELAFWMRARFCVTNEGYLRALRERILELGRCDDVIRRRVRR